MKRTMLAIAGGIIMGLTALPETVLFDFGKADELSRTTSKDVEATLVKNENGPAMRMVTGTEYNWPSVYMNSPEGWDFSAAGELTFNVKNLGTDPVSVNCRIDSAPKGNTDPKKVIQKTYNLLVEGERENTFHITLKPMTSSSKVKASDFFGMRGTPFGGDSMYLDNVTQIIIFVNKSPKVYRFEVGNLVLAGTPDSTGSMPDNPFPILDEFGQYKHRDWPGKVHSFDEMIKFRDDEAKDLAANARPSSWNTYGGWKDGPSLKATGYFRTEKYNGKWYLVDPEGKLFFSQGIDCVGTGNYTALDDRRHWYEKLPPDDETTRDFYTDSKSHMMGYYYGGRKVRAFSFHRYNVMRKYGDNWKQKFYDISSARLPSWGINTIANWSTADIYFQRKVPYTATIGTSAPSIEGSSGYWGKFKDVFHPDFKANLKKRVKEASFTNTVNDPWCIGYFVDNEIGWGDETSLALGTLMSPAAQPAKIAFIDELKKKYADIGALNTVWGTSYDSWDAMLASTNTPAKGKGTTDLTNFYDSVASMYFRTIRDVLKEASPNQLYMGCRFAWANPLAIKVSARYCDVVSYNIYAKTPKEKKDMMKGAGDKPYIIGEFHFGALDRGMFHTGLVAVKNQDERAVTYTRYVTDCLTDPNIVGCHWFQYMDSPVTGRTLDGENYQIGFIDNSDTPYAEIIAASRKLGATMYQTRAGK
ncbi:MAG: beta-galactosidase [Spirochaetes bacterium]|nr:beta-galactosidase [Spirochaetota bacterium]